MDKPGEAALKRAIGMLEATLKRQIELHNAMKGVAENKRETIIKGDLEALEKVVAEEKQLVAEIEEEEKARTAVMPMVRRGLDMESEEDKLSDLIERMPEPERTRLEKVRLELKDAIEECRRLTRHNAELLKASLEHVEAFLRTVAEASKPDANYNRRGRRDLGGPTLLDRNA